MNFENWCNGERSKIEYFFSNNVILKMMLSKDGNNKKCAPKLVFFNKKEIKKDSVDFKLFLHFESYFLALFDTSPLLHQIS